MTVPCFVDANVLVYAHNPAETQKRSIAIDLLHRLWLEASGRTSIQVLNEFYVVVTRKLSAPMGQNEAWAELEELFLWNPQRLDSALLRRAHLIEARYKLNWWDCLIVAAAQQQDCAVLYTEDLQHGALFDGVRVCNPFVSQVQEVPAPYRVAAASRHRPRGRPRKHAA
jgi:predicted nucleic acid-binding protein